MQNVYRARLATQERPCFVCSKFTPVVLTSADESNTDWFYVCRSHLGDHNFCTRIGGEPKPASRPTSPRKKLDDREPESDSVKDLISTIGSAWSSWRNSNGKSEDKDNKEKDKDKDKEEEQKKKEVKDNGDERSEEAKKQAENDDGGRTSSPASTPPTKPVQFILQRDYYYLRQREYTKKMQKKEAGQRLETLQFPQVPKERPVAK